MAHPQEAQATLSIKTLGDGDLTLLRLNKVIEGEVSDDETQRGYIEQYLSQNNTELLTASHQQALQNLSSIKR